MSSTNLLLTRQMNYLIRGATFTPPSSLYVALFTTPPTIDGTGGIEVSQSSTGYARVPVQSIAGNWSGPDANLLYSNVNDIVFGVPTGNWGTVTAIGMYSASTGGDLFFVANLTTARTIGNGEGAPKFAAGSFKFSPVR